jgi:hypothetical protein
MLAFVNVMCQDFTESLFPHIHMDCFDGPEQQVCCKVIRKPGEELRPMNEVQF